MMSLFSCPSSVPFQRKNKIDFNLPVKFKNTSSRMRTLTVDDVVNGFDAVFNNIDHLQKIIALPLLREI